MIFLGYFYFILKILNKILYRTVQYRAINNTVQRPLYSGIAVYDCTLEIKAAVHYYAITGKAPRRSKDLNVTIQNNLEPLP